MAKKHTFQKIVFVLSVGTIGLMVADIAGVFPHNLGTPGGTVKGPMIGAASKGKGGCAFIPGVQYVGRYGNGYVVYVGGKLIGTYQDQPTAEAAYNAAVGC